MNTAFLLMAQYNGQAVIPLDTVCRDYFAPLTEENLRKKVTSGEIKIPLVRMSDKSQKSARGIHLQDLANFIDERRSEALKESAQLHAQKIGGTRGGTR